MDSLIIFILIATLIVPFLIAYYYDYKSDPKGFSSSVKSVAKGFLRYAVILIVGLVLNGLYEALIPFDKDHGISFNSERQKMDCLC